MAQTFDYNISIPVTATLQDEEIEDCKATLAALIAQRNQRGESTRGLTLSKVILDRTIEKAVEALQIGAIQYAGALITVTARED